MNAQSGPGQELPGSASGEDPERVGTQAPVVSSGVDAIAPAFRLQSLRREASAAAAPSGVDPDLDARVVGEVILEVLGQPRALA